MSFLFQRLFKPRFLMSSVFQGLILFFGFFLNPTQASEELYYQGYQRSGCTNLMEYMQVLSTREESDTLSDLSYKKVAIAYFMSTGGPSGFTKTPATSEEKEILLKALSFAAVLHENLGCQDPFDLLETRRSFGKRYETETEKAHLLFAQTTLTATRVLVKAGQFQPGHRFVKAVRQLYQTECLPILRLNFQDQQQQFNNFCKVFTKELGARILNVFNSVEKSNATTPSRMPLGCYSEKVFQDYINTICSHDESATTSSPYLDVQHKPLKVTLANGLTVYRRADGYMQLRPNRSIHVGKLFLSPSSTHKARISLQEPELQLSKYQDQEEFLAALSAWSNILKTEIG